MAANPRFFKGFLEKVCESWWFFVVILWWKRGENVVRGWLFLTAEKHATSFEVFCGKGKKVCLDERNPGAIARPGVSVPALA
jgi:hypothetical protein